MSHEYKVAGQTVRLEPDPSVVAVRFKPGPTSFRASAAAAAQVGAFEDRFEVPGEELTLVPTTQLRAPVAPSSAQATQAMASLNARSEVTHALPVFRVSGNQVVTTPRLLIGLDSEDIAAGLAAAHGLQIIESEPERMVVLVPEGSDPFAVAEALTKEKGVRYAEPDFVTIGRHVPSRITPAGPPILSDPLVSRQYAMTITRAVDAWEIQRADPAIRIAILDEGVQTSHPDLRSAIVGAFDATDGDTHQEPNRWDGHGTACAGLAAAVGGNGVGIRGVAAGSSLMAVRIAYSNQPNGPWITTNSKIRDAIRWAWRSGADVLSNSWGGGAPSSDISAEFERARTLGRNGRGCVVVIAAGNEAGAVSFPGTLRDVLTVSASNEYDEAKTMTSRDGETWWGTNHGPEIDIAAPGVHNMTTDISGADGYAPDDYTQDFNGTSSATPIVAGACALVLSANPALTGNDVARIITSTAEKVGQFPYVGGRNDYFGSGRLDVYAAVRMALGQVAATAGADAVAEPAE